MKTANRIHNASPANKTVETLLDAAKSEPVRPWYWNTMQSQQPQFDTEKAGLIIETRACGCRILRENSALAVTNVLDDSRCTVDHRRKLPAVLFKEYLAC